MVDIKQAAGAYSSAAKIGNGMIPGVGGIEEIAGGPNFSDLVSDAMTDAANAGYKTEAISTESLANKADLHDLVAAVANAELTLNTVVAVRDKIITAYHDIIKMPI